MATTSDTALRYASASVPMRFESKSLFIASRGIRLNVVAIADHPAIAGATNVSAIPKQYSKGRFEADDRANVRVREYNSRRRCRRPDPKEGNVKRTNL
jgi:acetoacetate decarboxylase